MESLLEKKIKSKHASNDPKYKTHKKVNSKPFVENVKSRNMVPKTQKQGTYESRTRNKSSTQFLYKTYGDIIERRGAAKRPTKNSLGYISKGSLDKKSRKSKNNRLSLVGAISSHSRNVNLAKTSSKDVAAGKCKLRKSGYIRDLKKVYIGSMLQPSLSMKYN